jgi:hypothetical protein
MFTLKVSNFQNSTRLPEILAVLLRADEIVFSNSSLNACNSILYARLTNGTSHNLLLNIFAGTSQKLNIIQKSEHSLECSILLYILFSIGTN